MNRNKPQRHNPERQKNALRAIHVSHGTQPAGSHVNHHNGGQGEHPHFDAYQIIGKDVEQHPEARSCTPR